MQLPACVFLPLKTHPPPSSGLHSIHPLCLESGPHSSLSTKTLVCLHQKLSPRGSHWGSHDMGITTDVQERWGGRAVHADGLTAAGDLRVFTGKSTNEEELGYLVPVGGLCSVVGQPPCHHYTLSAPCLESLGCCCCMCCQYPSSDGGRARHCSELTWRRPCHLRGPELLESLTWRQCATAHSTRSARTWFTPLTCSLTAFLPDNLSSLR